MDNDQIVDIILKFEAGFVDNPADHGGPTNYGITAAQLGQSLGQSTPASIDQVRNLTREEARAIYKERYIAKPGFNQVANAELRLVLVDSGVLHGPARAVRWLQQSLNISADGVFGPSTLKALAACADQAKLARQVLGLRFKSIADIVSSDRSQATFLRGWVNRAATLLDYV